MTGKRKLNTLELSDSFVKKIKDKNKFARKLGVVTIIVGIAQGLSAIGIYKLNFLLYFALGFTIFSFISVFIKLWNKWSTFALIKIICYSIVLCLFIYMIMGGK